MRSAVRLIEVANPLHAFVGTVSSTDTTAGTVTVNVTRPVPNGLFSGTDTFDVGSQTIVLGNSGSTLFGSFGNVLVDFPQSSSSSSSSSSATATKASIRRAERRALKLLRHEQAKYGHHKKKQTQGGAL
jgi:hypothetical protein